MKKRCTLGPKFFKVLHAQKLCMHTKKINQTSSLHSVVRIKVGISQFYSQDCTPAFLFESCQPAYRSMQQVKDFSKGRLAYHNNSNFFQL